MARGWFSRRVEPDETGLAVDTNDVNHISASTVVKGDILSDNDIRIDGQVDGLIYSKGRVVVGENARLSGTLLCHDLDFWGKIEGDIYVQDMLRVKASGSIDGNVSTGKIEIEMDSAVNGSVNMIGEEDFNHFVDEIVGDRRP